MKLNQDMHLSEDQILLAVVGDEDLSPYYKEHLSSCLQCQEHKSRVEGDLSRLGRLARSLSPLPKRRLSLPAETRSFWIWSWRVKTAFGLAIAAILVIFVMGEQDIFKTIRSQKPVVQTRDTAGADTFEDEGLMTNITALSKNALPEEYMDIAAGSDPKIDEGFMEFMAPAVEDEPLSEDSNYKGDKPC
ncbi:hypothetical protein PITCH_A1010018 [uncultured Desulfobacterium sp.]|uniref:Zinc-finger domain-containing protein n=1 Tax=uncultured Desulfobacterium sp. TaxID=201089 RepID=A0A445MQN1_9BACT|nr:hypothetical protein PITCH_A1010018 [uncultured Desulfobacterium sp.]